MSGKAQGKVSMVVPCYNKEAYIGAMLDSVLAQEWDNIEPILVNDGSTDGTRGVIEAYVPRFAERGYDLKIIDQENGGCCKAVHTGLVNMTGEYFCLVDADDEIEPRYVSTMAGWLAEHSEYEWACCSYRVCIRNDDGSFTMQAMTSCANMSDNRNLLERHIIRKEITTSWIYMTRTGYIEQTKLLDTFCTARKMTYEPLFAVPLMLGGGRLKTIDEPLYKFNRHGSDMYYFDSYAKIVSYYKDYSDLYRHCIDRSDLARDEKSRFHRLIDYGYRKDLLYHLNGMDGLAKPIPDAENYLGDFAESFSEFIDGMIAPKPRISKYLFMRSDYFEIIDPIDNIILKGESAGEKIDAPRLIGYGTLGRVAKRLLPVLADANVRFDCLWDKGANGETIFDVTVTKPDFDAVTDNDIIVVFPMSWEILAEAARNTGAAKIVYAPADHDIVRNLRLSKMFHKRTFVFDRPGAAAENRGERENDVL
jgi:glycosyltransferase involved in cell wall biosynthesis